MVSQDKCVYMLLSVCICSSSLTVNDMFRNINANLVQLKNLVTSQIREAKSLRADLSSLNDSVSNLSVCLQEHKQQTAAELAQLQTSLNITQSSLTTHMKQVNAKLNTLTTNLSQHHQQTSADAQQLVLLQTSLNTTQSSVESKLNYLSPLREDLSNLNDSVSNLSMCLQEHKQQTAAELAQLQTSYQFSLTTHTQQVNAKLNTLNASLSQHQQQTASSLETVSSKLKLLTSTTAQLSTGNQQILANISDVECVDTEESSELHQNLQNNLTHQLETIRRYVDQIPVYTCGGTGGWRRVVYLDMTDPSTTCPSGWQLTGYSKRTCGRASVGSLTCDSVTFSVSRGEYSRVCGRIKAYQWGATLAFHNYHYEYMTTIDGAYVSGISVTHSSPRQHIWTFRAGAAEGNPTWSEVCPCDASYTIHIPPFVGKDYICESGVNEPWNDSRHHTLHSNDTLWDGENCLSSSTCCSLHNPPYFVKQLPTPTNDDIEARICMYYPLNVENIAVEVIELYVQ